MIWKIVTRTGKVEEEHTNKRLAYRRCQTLNGKKVNGEKPYHVQRDLAAPPRHGSK